MQPYANGPTFTKDFGKKKQDRHVKVLQMAENELKGAWEACVTLAMPKKIAVEDEVQKAVSSRVRFSCLFGNSEILTYDLFFD